MRAGASQERGLWRDGKGMRGSNLKRIKNTNRVFWANANYNESSKQSRLLPPGWVSVSTQGTRS